MKKRSALAVLFLVVFIDLVGFGIVLPLLPRYAKQYGVSNLEQGVLMASFSAMQFLLSIDRSHLASGSSLIARFAVAYLAAVGAVAFAQRPFFVLFANRRTAPKGR